MNRQTLAVTFGTLALVVMGAILLYATPTPEGNLAQPRPTPASKPPPEAQGAGVLPNGKLVHTTPVPEDRVAAPQGAPNVVMVLPSTMRRDQLTVYDSDITETTPFLAKQGAAGVVFEDALSVSVDPRTAAASLTTGRTPHAVGMIERGKRRNARALPREVVTLAESLQEAGWYTLGLSANHNLNERAGQHQGFDWYRDSQPYGFMLDRRIQAPELVDRTLTAVDARSEADRARPLYLQVAFVDNHKPFRVPPEEFQKFVAPDHDIAPYRAVLRRVDDELGRLVAGLAERGITEDNTVFVFVGDHGEGLKMPPHHRKQHGRVLYESVVRIPWVMWGEGVASGKRIEGLASQLDVVPTVRSLVGLPAGEVDGLDLSAAVEGAQPRTGRETAYADTYFEGADRASIWTETRQCQRDYGSEGITDSQFQDGCFDRKTDPTFTTVLQDEALLTQLDAERAERLKELDK